jgi:hypothetical protein
MRVAVESLPMALEHAQQVMLAQIDVAQDVTIPVTAPTHIFGLSPRSRCPAPSASSHSQVYASAADPFDLPLRVRLLLVLVPLPLWRILVDTPPPDCPVSLSL